jgi:LmbE family N-acetylglucosaminyl deacetylase
VAGESILVIAPHPDDETLGVGGTIARAAATGARVCVVTVAAHMPPLYAEEIHRRTVAEAREAHAALGVAESVFLDLPAVFVRDRPAHELNAMLLEAVRRVAPRVVLVCYPDRHVDHRAVFEAAMVATRPVGPGRAISVLACYETLSETHWNAPHIEPSFTPNWVVDVTATIETKCRALGCYASQIHPFPAPRSIEAARALAAFRGTQAGFAYGEGLHVVRMTAPPESFLAAPT